MAGKIYSGIGKVAVIAASLLTGLAGIVSAQEKKPTPIIDNFDYASHRTDFNGKYKGKIFNYNILSDGSVAQSDKKGVSIEQLWFWDIDGDGQFGEAELKALKAGIQIFMNKAFNDVANPRVQKFLEKVRQYSELEEKLKQAERNSEAKDKANHQLIGEYEKDIEKYKVDLKTAQDQIATGVPKQDASVPAQSEAPKQKPYATLIFDANANTEGFGLRLGGRYNFNDTFGIGAGVGIDAILNRAPLNVTTPMSNKGIYANLMKNQNGFGFGPYIDGKAGPLTARLGLDYWNLNTETTEQMMKYGAKLPNPTILRESKNLVSLYGELMLEMPVAKGISIRGGAGADTLRKIYGILGIGAELK